MADKDFEKALEDEYHAALTALEKRLIDQGLILEAGWSSFSRMIIPDNAHSSQIECMRLAFFSGALHLFRSVTRMLDPGDEPTTLDLQRMDNINGEIERFLAEINAKFGRTKGNA